MGKKILIVDDNELDREIMHRFLKKAGYDNIIMAETGQEGLDKARTENPDLVILDIMLPKIDGYKVCRMLKFDSKFKNIPVIMCTSLSQDSDKKLGSDVGADFYYTKDFDPDDLLARIKEILGE